MLLSFLEITLYATPLLGTVQNPYPAGYNIGVGGITVFLSNIIKLIAVVGGLLAFLNLVIAGLRYIMSGSDPKALQEAGSSITMSIVGLVIIAASFIITAIISILVFGDPTAILNPKIYGPDKQPGTSITCPVGMDYDTLKKMCCYLGTDNCPIKPTTN